MKMSDYDDFPSVLPVVVQDNLFLYPFMISPIFLDEQQDIDAVTEAMENHSLLFITSSKEGHEGKRDFEDIHSVGVIGSIMRRVQLPDGRIKILFQGHSRGRIVEPVEGNTLKALVDVLKAEPYDTMRIDALMGILRDKIKQLAALDNAIPDDLVRTIEENGDPERMTDLISSMLKMDKTKAYEIFTQTDLEKRMMRLLEVINAEIEAAKIQREIRSRVNDRIEQSNKEYFLKEQLKEIQHELGMDTQRDEEIEAFRNKLEELKPYLNEEAYKEIDKQIERLARMHPDSADANVIQSYLEWVLEIPFDKTSKNKLSVEKVAEALDKDHYSLEKPKERIVEFFSVRELAQLRGVAQKETEGAILCFSGPPGVGKTSLANSIAEALGRPLVRIALGGLEDVNELRGHRRTYVGAMPGRIVQGLIEAGTMDPVIVLDEIDKVGRSMRGDPTAALLEILDPEQNSHYRDFYLNFHIDLSKALFIATANDVGRIPAPLRDRMEFIMLSSYTPEEKFQIAKRYLIPQELKKHALKPYEFSMSDKALRLLIDEYTREAGVRNLRRKIATLMRKTARIILEDKTQEKVHITKKNLPKFIDKKVFEFSVVDKKPQVGVVAGLAWTAVGGDVLTVEAIKIKGKGMLQLTGSLGDVMKESARIAHSVVKILIDERKLSIAQKVIPKTYKEKEEGTHVDASEVYKRYDLHIHVPEGATPKDGPSAGITMVTAIASILSERKVDNRVAMTGEVTLTGKVLPIGGLKEKLIAAYKAGVTKALIPEKNYERDLDEIPDEVKEHLDIVPVKTVDDVLKEALL